MSEEFKKLIGLLIYNNILFDIKYSQIFKYYWIQPINSTDYVHRLWEIDTNKEEIGFELYIRHKKIQVNSAEDAIDCINNII